MAVLNPESCRARNSGLRAGIITAILLVVLFLLPGCALLQRKFAKSLDPPSGTISLDGASGEIVVRRDSLGVPFIETQNESDLFFASGYVAAEDRLWQMVMMSMLAQGRLSEIAGSGMLKMDLLLRTLNAKKYVDEALKQMNDETLRIFKDYSRGVNAYLERHVHLPAEVVVTGYRPTEWKPEDTFYGFCALNLNVSAVIGLISSG